MKTETRTAIQTRSGRMLDFLNPDPDAIDIRDIAHALALTNRYGGHTAQPYSVAQHCVLCSIVAPRGLELQALMHDAQEAYTGDVPKPLKNVLPDYRDVEDRIERVVRKKFGLPKRFDPRVKAVDSRMLVTEAQQLGFLWWPALDAEPFDLNVRPWSWGWARRRFLDRFKELT